MYIYFGVSAVVYLVCVSVCVCGECCVYMHGVCGVCVCACAVCTVHVYVVGCLWSMCVGVMHVVYACMGCGIYVSGVYMCLLCVL